jgi:hypothetical protein
MTHTAWERECELHAVDFGQVLNAPSDADLVFREYLFSARRGPTLNSPFRLSAALIAVPLCKYGHGS